MPEPVRVLLDPGDDVRVSVGLLERHDPAGGLVVAHPTPGVSSPAATAHDVLAALGRSVRRLAAERLVGLESAGRAVQAWLLTDEIEDLVVLRADRLSAAGWDWLLQVCRRTGVRLLLVCHVHAVPAALAAVLEGVEHQIVTDLRQALPDRVPESSRTELQPAPQAHDLLAYDSQEIEHYRRLAPETIGLRGFLGTDEVFQQGQGTAAAWLDTHLAPGARVLDIAQVLLFLIDLVQDSPSRNHTLARMRGAQAGFRTYGFDLVLPPWKSMAEGRLRGPGLEANGPDLSPAVLQRIRAGVAHPAIGAGIAISLLTSRPVLFLRSLPWEALSPDNAVLRLTGFPGYATLFPSTTTTFNGKAPLTAVFRVPAAVRPLLQALRHFADLDPKRPHHRMFASTPFTLERIAPAAAHCAITLPDQNRWTASSLYDTWQGWVTCTHISRTGQPSDTQIRLDQIYSPRRAQRRARSLQTTGTPPAYSPARITYGAVS